MIISFINLMTKEKHYNTLSNYYKAKYGKKVAKISLNANFSCPNKDGTKGTGGCVFCSTRGFTEGSGDSSLSLEKQFQEVSKRMLQKWPDSLFIPYLQSNSNTYASVDVLKETYEKILSLDKEKKFVKLAIATRPDCLEGKKLVYLSQLNRRIPIQIELGLQTIHEKTATKINRGFDLQEFTSSVRKLRAEGIEVVVHIINGLPGETRKMMVETVKYLNDLDIQGIKIHNLLIFRNTKLFYQYKDDPFHLLTLEEYAEIVCEQLQNLSKKIIVHRLSADGPKDAVHLPHWSFKKWGVINTIDKRMRKLNIFQGDFVEEIVELPSDDEKDKFDLHDISIDE